MWVRCEPAGLVFGLSGGVRAGFSAVARVPARRLPSAARALIAAELGGRQRITLYKTDILQAFVSDSTQSAVIFTRISPACWRSCYLRWVCACGQNKDLVSRLTRQLLKGELMRFASILLFLFSLILPLPCAAQSKDWQKGILLDSQSIERYAGSKTSAWGNGPVFEHSSAVYARRINYAIKSGVYIYLCQDLDRRWKTLPAVNEPVKFYIKGDHLYVADSGGGSDHKMRINTKISCETETCMPKNDPLGIR